MNEERRQWADVEEVLAPIPMFRGLSARQRARLAVVTVEVTTLPPSVVPEDGLRAVTVGAAR